MIQNEAITDHQPIIAITPLSLQHFISQLPPALTGAVPGQPVASASGLGWFTRARLTGSTNIYICFYSSYRVTTNGKVAEIS